MLMEANNNDFNLSGNNAPINVKPEGGGGGGSGIGGDFDIF